MTIDTNGRTTVSWSEISSWTSCRQKWYYSYDLGIERRAGNRAPSLGSCGHEALRAWWTGQKTITVGAAIDAWIQRELSTRPLFDEEILQYQQVADVVRQIIPRYADHYGDHVNFKFLATEQQFSVPVPGVRNLRFEGYFDAIVEERKTGRVWLMESKFPSQFRTEEDIDLDGQLGVYHYAALKSGYPVVGVIYNQILARVPSVPSRNKDGSFSRAKVYTDWETYRSHVVNAGLRVDDYMDMMEKLAGIRFFERYYRYRSPDEVIGYVHDLVRRVREMRRVRKHIYMSPNRFNCASCQFRDLCLEKVRCRPLDDLIHTQYMPRMSRRDLPMVEGEEETFAV